MSSIFPILLLLGGIAGFALARPVWEDVSRLQAEREDLNQITASIDKSRERKDELLAELALLPKDGLARLKQMVPEESRREDILLMLTNIGRKNGVTVKSVTFTEARAQVEGDFASVDTSVAISGNYPSLVQYVKDVESALRLSDIERATVSATGKNPMEMQIVLRSYYVEKKILE